MKISLVQWVQSWVQNSAVWTAEQQPQRVAAWNQDTDWVTWTSSSKKQQENALCFVYSNIIAYKMTIFRDSPLWEWGDTDVFLYRGGEWKCATYSGNSLGFGCEEVWLPSQLSSFIPWRLCWGETRLPPGSRTPASSPCLKLPQRSNTYDYRLWSFNVFNKCTVSPCAIPSMKEFFINLWNCTTFRQSLSTLSPQKWSHYDD